MFLSRDSALIPTQVVMDEAQRQDRYWWNIQTMVGTVSTTLFNEVGLLCRKSPVDGSLQAVVPQKYRAAALQHAYYPTIAGHSSGQRAYYSLKRE